MSPRGLSLADALAAIKSTRTADREAGLRDLKHVLQRNKASVEISKLKDKSLLPVFEDLIRSVNLERSNFIKGVKIRSVTESRLTCFAEALHLLATTFVSRLRSRTLFPTIDHVVNALPGDDDALIAPLANPYLKTLVAILSYTPHVEQLSSDEWQQVTDFCCTAIRTLTEDAETQNGTSESRSFFEQNTAHSSMSRPVSQNQGPKSLARNSQAQHLALCLASLTHAPNFPALNRTGPVIECLLSFLDATQAVPVAVDAFRAINNCLNRQKLSATLEIKQTLPKIVRIIRDIWSRNLDGPKNEMLKTLVICFPFIEDASPSSEFLDSIESLLDTMAKDYMNNASRGPRHLRLEDLRLNYTRRLSPQITPLQNASFSLRKSSEAPEHNWALLSIIAGYNALVDEMRGTMNSDHEVNDSPGPPKRLRRISRITDVIYEARRSVDSQQLHAIQIVAFIVSNTALSPAQLLECIEFLNDCTSLAESSIASWSLLALSGCALQTHASMGSLRPQWIIASQSAIRLLSSLPHSRAAAHTASVMLDKGLLAEQDVPHSHADVTRNFSQILPAIMSDAAISWLTSLLKKFSSTSTGATVASFADAVCNWLVSKWSPSSFENWSYASNMSYTASMLDIHEIFNALCQSRPLPEVAPFPCLFDIGRMFLEQGSNSDLLTYILARAETRSLQPSSRPASGKVPAPIVLSAGARKSLENKLVEFLYDEVDKSLTAWQEAMASKSRSITVESFSVVLSLACIANITVNSSSQTHSARLMNLRDAAGRLVQYLAVFLISPEATPAIAAAAFEIVWALLPGSQSLRQTMPSSNITILSQTALKALFNALSSQSFLGASRDEDEDFDEDFGDQKDSQPETSQHDWNLGSRDYISCSAGPDAFRSCCLTYLAYCQGLAIGQQDDALLAIPDSFITHIIELPTPSFISVRPVLKVLEEADCPLSLDDAERLLVHIAETILPDYSHRFSEGAIQSCLQALKMTMHLWADDPRSSLSNVAYQLYTWLLDRHLSDHKLAPGAQKELASFLSDLLPHDFKEPEKEQSVLRKQVLSLLRDSDIGVKFSLAEKLPRLFEVYTLDTHKNILESILMSLPFQMEWLEGIALRLHTFTILAEAWSTLLPSCVFRIVETVGNVAAASDHAQLCLNRLAKSLGLPTPRKMFTLFRATLLVHWINNGNELSAFPHAIFGFNCKADLYNAASSDIVPFLAPTDHLQEVVSEVHISGRQLCLDHFPSCLAYALGADIDASAGGKPNSHDAELKLRQIIGGQDQMNSLAADFFPSTVADMFAKMDSEDAIKRALDRRKGYEDASKLYSALQAGDPKDEYLPHNLQPCFKAQIFLIDAIERLCRRAGQVASSIWSTPSTVSLIVRSILDSVHPALGSIQARRTLRKLRVLVVLSGRACYKGYVLEQLLSAIRPWVSNVHCSQEAATLYQHLLTYGEQHLRTREGFVLGTCLALNLESSRLLKAKQDSTTQDSSYRATVSKAEAFRQWLGQWSSSYVSSISENRSLARHYSSLMSLSQTKMGQANSSKETPEGRLLHGLLHDMLSSRRILSPPMTERCFRLVTNNDFKPADLTHEDIFGAPASAHRLAPSLWKLGSKSGLSPSFSSWAAKALGRSYQHNGQIPADIASESGLAQLKSLSIVQSDVISSFAAVLRTLAQLLDDEDQGLVSLSEMTLRRILLATTDMDQRDMLQQCLESDLGDDLSMDSQYRLLGDVPRISKPADIRQTFRSCAGRDLLDWTQELVLVMIHNGPSVDLVNQLIPALEKSRTLSQKLLPYVLHSLLYFARQEGTPRFQELVSEGFNFCLGEVTDDSVPHAIELINALVYLRTRLIPGEQSKFDRNRWLNIDLQQASVAARFCKMFKTALLFAEIDQSQEAESSGRRSSRSVIKQVPDNLLLSIFREIDEPDAFHGVPQAPSIDSVIERLAFEGSGVKELLLRGARADGMLRAGQPSAQHVLGGMIDSLTSLNMSSLAVQLSGGDTDMIESQSESMAKAAIKLQQWDISLTSEESNNSSVIYSALQSIDSSSNVRTMQDVIDKGATSIFANLTTTTFPGKSLKQNFAALAALCDLDDAVKISSVNDLTDMILDLEQRQSWMVANSPDTSASILLAREAFFGILSKNKTVQGIFALGPRESKLAEVRAGLQACRILRENGSIHDALGKVAYLTECIGPCADVGLEVSAAVQMETSHVLWAQGELIPSIRMLRDLSQLDTLETQHVPVNRPALLAALGSHVSDARLEKPDEVMRNYLAASVTRLRESGNERGLDAGRVYHAFASYCHNQLTNAENVEELRRSEQARDKRATEIHELEAILKQSRLEDREKQRVKSDRNKAKKWYDMDAKETERLRHIQESFLRQSLDGYLHSLGASDEHDTDVLRFLSLWLEHAANEEANKSVSRVVQVPSMKFAPLMNQLASRLQDSGDKFQETMKALVERICREHPHHSMYHIYAGSKTSGGNDRIAISRNQAAMKMASRLAATKDSQAMWHKINRANEIYMALANAKSEAFKAGVRIDLRKISAGKMMERDIPALQVAPLTMNVALRADCDYSQVPYVESFRKDMVIAGGLSAPKIVTAVASDGSSCKQLFKAGADDLRQDAIMEQVFEQVSALLQTQKETRRRQLQIRTYKVVPLDAQSGAIEFVQNTQPLNDYLRSAHVRYHPKDFKWEACRAKIDEVRTAPVAKRVEVYRTVAQNFHPVLRHFFFERFEEPDEWFAKRLAYTRSTAAISILGHALGLGDRHCQNILLDTNSGEMVHIDLGVAFEAGRILAVPEVVPFRLTRDIVDGFGIMGVEGVFRRCSEFTLEALRSSRDAIMTLLNVLRYDPLYSWSMSPLRARRLQEEQDLELEGGGNGRSAKSFADDGGEAERALGVVERKLAAGLSVQATVNELILQATDDRNLALLFCGWAAFA